jgi:putative Mn2+ efflux pump MntP
MSGIAVFDEKTDSEGRSGKKETALDLFAVVLIAFGLAMDATAVSIATGSSISKGRFRIALRMGASFGLFQALMPIAGWLCGKNLRGFLAGIDHWVAFALLVFVGAKMIYESLKMKRSEKRTGSVTPCVLLLLSVATSIDALAVGFSFAFLGVAIAAPVVVIGFVTFILSFAGVLIGSGIGHFLESKMEAIGGLVLIGIGIKILVEHLMGRA